MSWFWIYLLMWIGYTLFWFVKEVWGMLRRFLWRGKVNRNRRSRSKEECCLRCCLRPCSYCAPHGGGYMPFFIATPGDANACVARLSEQPHCDIFVFEMVLSAKCVFKASLV